MWKRMLLICALTSFVAGCATAPSAPPPTKVEVICPRLPTLEPLDQETETALAQDFTGRMANFLAGRLPDPIVYELRSGPAAPRARLTSKP